ncbi:MAG: hypothetical protein JW741_09770 [Sedimentisphaerales bacterium]|nr:hypothetical protein [Sedimentisphaerales bacterium]
MRFIRTRTHWDHMVVFVCIALACLTLGAVGQSGRRRGRELVCQSNLRQWGGIFQGYIERNDGWLFSGAPGTAGYWWPRELDEAHKDWKRMRIWFCPESTGPVVGEDGVSNPGLSVFSAWGIYRGTELGPNGISGSYGLNGYCITPQGGHGSTYEGGVPVSEGWQDLRDLAHGETVPLFVEALRFDLWPRHTDGPAVSEFAAWSGNHMARCCINRHNGAVSCLFVDGSVRRVGLKEFWTLKWHRSHETEGPWTKAGGAVASDWPQWMRQFKDY